MEEIDYQDVLSAGMGGAAVGYIFGSSVGISVLFFLPPDIWFWLWSVLYIAGILILVIATEHSLRRRYLEEKPLRLWNFPKLPNIFYLPIPTQKQHRAISITVVLLIFASMIGTFVIYFL